MGTFVDTATSLSTIMVDTTFDSVTTALGQEEITNAENEVRKILARRYDVSSAAFQTSTSTPPMVTTITKWLAAGYMYDAMSRGGEDAFARADRYIKRAMDNLEAIANFEQNLVDSVGSEITEDSDMYQVLSNTEDYHDTFAEDDPKLWSIDSDKLDDIKGERD